MNPKFKRNLSRVLPFGVIWLVTGWVFLLNEVIVTGNQNLNPDTAVTLTFPVFIFASMAITLVGILVGVIELVILERKFRYASFAKKVSAKFGIYLCLMLMIMGILFPIAKAIELSRWPLEQEVLNITANFFSSLIFLNTVVQIAFHLLLSLLYAAISENLGHQVLRNFFTGKYHRPTFENRVFMFLDMKNSTTLAETLGNLRYFELLQAYYDLMSEAIISTRGEIYQYIGDEVVITWESHLGLVDNNCITCYRQLKKQIYESKDFFMAEYGVYPDFKAGLHLGEVTSGEIGALKREVVFTGDVLNTTARIRGLCEAYGTDLIISDILLEHLAIPATLDTNYLGDLSLKGKEEKVKLHAVEV